MNMLYILFILLGEKKRGVNVQIQGVRNFILKEHQAREVDLPDIMPD